VRQQRKEEEQGLKRKRKAKRRRKTKALTVFTFLNGREKSLRILITGTPSTGKTTVAKKLAELLNHRHIEVAKVIVEEKLYKGLDKIRGSFIVDVKRARKFFSAYLTEHRDVILDSHVVEIFPRKLIDKVLVLRVHPLLIFKRGIEKGWSLEKCLENAQAELLGVCLFDTLRFYGRKRVWQVDSTCRSVEEVVAESLSILQGKRRRGRIDWLTKLEKEGRLDLLLEMEKARDLPVDFFKLLSNCG
jgi:adenylate kinase